MRRWAGKWQYRTAYTALERWRKLMKPPWRNKSFSSHWKACGRQIYTFLNPSCTIDLDRWKATRFDMHESYIWTFFRAVVMLSSIERFDHCHPDNFQRKFNHSVLCHAEHEGLDRPFVLWRVRRSWDVLKRSNYVRICCNDAILAHHEPSTKNRVELGRRSVRIKYRDVLEHESHNGWLYQSVGVNDAHD